MDSHALDFFRLGPTVILLSIYQMLSTPSQLLASPSLIPFSNLQRIHIRSYIS